MSKTSIKLQPTEGSCRSGSALRLRFDPREESVTTNHDWIYWASVISHSFFSGNDLETKTSQQLF